ncbi:MAG: phosphoribosylglycinamide formyltransferase [Deltaproteobacteria bacterium]|nr:phosphoribosylglycinamide formyltransferase [Deltaproteobacteria bacterium]
MLSTNPKAKLAVLVSGTGSNLEAIIKATQNSKYPAYVGVVISDQKEALALKKATAHQIPAVFVNPKLYDSREAYDQMLASMLKEYKVDLVILAGFMRVLSPIFVQAFPKKILNIHPALLPKYPGLHAVKEALESGDSHTGCTVHFVDEGVDTGPIIAQTQVSIKKGDTQDSLHARIKEQEYTLYPKAISDISHSLLIQKLKA